MRNVTRTDPDRASRAFREQMTLRREMLDIAGIGSRTARHSRDAQALLLRGIIACRACQNSGLCANWLSITQSPATPPDFCPMRDIVLELRQLLSAAAVGSRQATDG
jgi:hypothetical protein